MANIPVDGNYLSLLPTTIGKNAPQKYLNYSIPSYSELYSVMVKEHNRMIYILIYYRNTSNRIGYSLIKYNLLTNTSAMVWDRESYNFGKVTDFLIDDNNKMYLSFDNGQKFLYIVNLENGTESQWAYTTNKNNICYGKLEWVDSDNFIMLDDGPNLLKFNVADYSITVLPMTNGSTSGTDYCVGKKYIFSTHTKYDIENQTASTYTLPNNSTPKSVAYDNGRYYFALTNILYYYEEETDTWSSQIAVGWSNPLELRVHDNNCYAINNKSNKAFLYDIDSSLIYSFLMSWTLPDLSSTRLTRADMFDGVWMIARETMCYIRYETDLKYNAGPIANHIQLVYNLSTASDYEYDDRFITFTDTYVTINDGDIVYPDISHDLEIETIDQSRNLYAISVSKDDYDILKEVKM